MVDSLPKGLILLGGQSSRMGSDKAFLEWNGEKVLDKLLERLKAITSDVCLSVNDSQYHLLKETHQCIKDKYKLKGPMGGILSSLEALKSDLLVLAIDMPLIDKETLMPLIEAGVSSGKTTAFTNPNHQWHPLPSYWPKNAVDSLKTRLETNQLALNQYLKTFGKAIPIGDQLPYFLNVNRPTDIK
ncbi:molybdenum cofactor guanylyltransferase [Roseivirga sp.]|uniref:molybdenum cofactor guanylyltransferase n=1 Tax=Roseivirga sp. TaxID=1964215 RepID=UPI003B8C2DE2